MQSADVGPRGLNSITASLVALSLSVCAGCALVEQLPIGGETQVLVLGAVAYRAPLAPSNIEFANDAPASVLHYDEASEQLPWTHETALVRDGLECRSPRICGPEPRRPGPGPAG
jgi:hypothetical protein